MTQVSRATAERAIAQLVLFGGERLAAREVFRITGRDDFRDVRYRMIVDAARAISIDELVTCDRVINYLDEAGQLQHVGGQLFVKSLANCEDSADLLEAVGIVELLDVLVGADAAA